MTEPSFQKQLTHTLAIIAVIVGATLYIASIKENNALNQQEITAVQENMKRIDKEHTDAYEKIWNRMNSLDSNYSVLNNNFVQYLFSKGVTIKR